MESFEPLKTKLHHLGIWTFESNKRSWIFQIAFTSISYGFSISLFITTFWFFLFEAQMTSESTDSMFTALAALLLICWFTALLWQNKKYAILLADLDAIIEKSM